MSINDHFEDFMKFMPIAGLSPYERKIARLFYNQGFIDGSAKEMVAKQALLIDLLETQHVKSASLQAERPSVGTIEDNLLGPATA